MAMIKLWERSSIAKIALKRGVQLTTSERMAEDIKVINLLIGYREKVVFYDLILKYILIHYIV